VGVGPEAGAGDGDVCVVPPVALAAPVAEGGEGRGRLEGGELVEESWGGALGWHG
jgi:hypothetical protein